MVQLLSHCSLFAMFFNAGFVRVATDRSYGYMDSRSAPDHIPTIAWKAWKAAFRTFPLFPQCRLRFFAIARRTKTPARYPPLLAENRLPDVTQENGGQCREAKTRPLNFTESDERERIRTFKNKQGDWRKRGHFRVRTIKKGRMGRKLLSS